MNPRYYAVTILYSVINQQRSLTDVVAEAPLASLTQHEQAFIKALCFGVCRYYYQLLGLTACLLGKPLKHKDADIHILLLIGVFQLLYMHSLMLMKSTQMP